MKNGSVRVTGCTLRIGRNEGLGWRTITILRENQTIISQRGIFLSDSDDGVTTPCDLEITETNDRKSCAVGVFPSTGEFGSFDIETSDLDEMNRVRDELTRSALSKRLVY